MTTATLPSADVDAITSTGKLWGAACVARDWGALLSLCSEDVVFLPPDDGMMVWADNMLVPNMASHQRNAERWIDWYYQPEIAALLAAWVWYVCPVEGAREAMEDIDPSLVDNPLIFPTEEYLAQTHPFMALSEAQMREYEGDFADVITG